MPFEVPADLTATTYADADAADAAAELRVGGSAWLALTGDQKDAALATASRDIDSMEEVAPSFVGGFIGERSNANQPLAWPRTGTEYSSTAWPQRLVDATIELAFTYAPAFAAGATIDVLNADAGNGNIKREKIGPVETEFFTARATAATAIERFPWMVQRLLAPLIRVARADTWGSGTVTRAS